MSHRPPRVRFFLALLVLVTITGLSLKFIPALQVEKEPPINALPETAGAWKARPVLFCQSEQCGRSWVVEEGIETQALRCPVCGGKTDAWSLGERRSLDPDTMLMRRQYTNSTHGVLALTVVVNPTNANSIHRPQTCIYGQGYRIIRQREVAVPLSAISSMKLTVLELGRQVRSGGGQTSEAGSYLAYWFIDRNRQTPSHSALTMNLITDRLFRGKVSRWAYVTVSSEWNISEQTFLVQLHDLLKNVVPTLHAGTSAAP